MPKTILKTTLCTLLSLIFLLIIGFSFACFISPSKVASFVAQMGMDSFSTHLSIYQYNKSEDISDLGIAVERAIESKSHKEVEKYADKLITHEKYGEFVLFKNNQLDAENTSGISFFYDNYIESNYIYSSYKNSGASEELLKKATDYVEKTQNEYLLLNAVSRYVVAITEDKETRSIESVAKYIHAKYAQMATFGDTVYKADLKRMCFDMYTLYDYAGDGIKKTEWLNEYKKH